MERPLRHGFIAFIFLVILNQIPNTQSRHLSRPKREFGANLYLPGSHVIPGGEGDSSEWGPWGAPSECSRTCGGGVSHQTRECLNLDQYSRSLCQGGDKRYFSCNTQDCPEGEADFRQQQCSAFNHVAFEGVHYKWVPYRKAPNPCELNCMPEGERFYYRHNATVIDGTRCNEENLDVCVNGQCEKVGCDMMLGSTSKEDSCRRCEGDGSECRTLNGTLDMSHLQVGYNDILLIPAGATNIEIREIQPSNNYLAVRNSLGLYYLNGNWRIDFPSPKKFAGGIWHYERKPQGFAAPDHLSCLGPTTEPIYIVLLSQDVNVGIKYEYSVLESLAKQSRPDSYQWSYLAYSECSAKCGGGFQTRKVMCNNALTLEDVDTSLCDETTRPEDARQCGHEACPPRWAERSWGKCTAVCGKEGKQEREVLCEQVSEDGNATVVKDSVCLESVGNKPATEQECNRGVVCPQWYTGTWSSCSKLCGPGEQKREVICYRKENGKVVVLDAEDCPEEQPEAKRECTLRPCKGVDWITSSWSGCKSCGLTTETRTAFCASRDGTIYNDTFCANREKPELSRTCETKSNCEFQWFSSQWSKCSAECGKGVQTRTIVCGSFDGELVKRAPDESSCDAETKPEESRDCDGPAECPGQWFSGPWSACSSKCGGGEQTRKILCLVDNKPADSAKCDEETIEFGSQDCNMEPCVDDETIPVDVTSKSVTEDDEAEDDCEEDEDYTEDASIELGSRFGVTRADEAMESSDGFELDETTPAESSLMTDEMMMSDATGFETESTDGLTGVTPEGSGSTMFTDDGSGDDESLSTLSTDDSSQTTVESVTESGSTDGVTEEVSLSSLSQLGSSRSSDDDGDLITSTVSASSEGVSDSSAAPETTEGLTTESTYGSSTSESESTSDSTIETSTMDSTTESATETSTDSSTEASTDAATSEASTTAAAESTTLTAEDLTTTDSVTQSSVSAGSEETTVAESAGTTDSVTDDTTVSNTESATETTEDSSTVSSVTEESSSTDSGVTGSTDGSEGTTGSVNLDGRFGDDSTGTDFDIWSTTASGDDEGYSTTPNTLTEILAKEQKPRKCKPRAKKPACLKSEYGCCPDNSTAATGPFDEGCPIPETCKETKHGCCPDGLTPAEGAKNRGCPKEDCKDTLFGCCPDKKTPSKGNNNEECPVEPEKPKGCAAAKFGCCPDGKTEAKGKNNKGCKEEKPKTDKPKEDKPKDKPKEDKKEDKPQKGCSDSEFGCCPDGTTEATGKNYLGCDLIDEKDCTKSFYGCCPDNRTSATDANKGGCAECHNEIFGCCPDGSTPAHGANREGCCLDSEFGCCPDNIQAASGPKLEGCGCDHTQFGCCPDGSTTALGPDNHGCGCQYTEFGCCVDKTTEARGPKYEGCGCETFQFGCCPDGVSVPTGPHNYGCYCAHSEHKCCPDGVTHAKGPDFAGCTCAHSKFGCCPDGVSAAEGESFEGCENIPTSPQKACGMPEDRGVGTNYTVKYFFDSKYGGCSRFWYAGSEGNANRFDSDDECKATCIEPTGKDACHLPKSVGACTGYEPMWYFDEDRKQCLQFVYGGCLGNNNKYATREACESVCAAGLSQPVCSQPEESGPCNGNFERWAFNEEAGECRPFRYGGCKGNKNNYETEAACKYGCKKPGIHSDKCTDAKDPGQCGGKLARWAFSTSDNKCMPFYYTGCEGNNNNYRTEEECETVCPAERVKNACELPADTGPCQNYTARWYFNTMEGRCRQFYYGGCDGNGNNFEQEHECKAKCDKPAEEVPVRPRIQPEAEDRPREPSSEFRPGDCHLEPEEGTGEEPGRRFHYSRHYGICTEFMYNGEGGNANNFKLREECDEQCERHQDTCSLPAFAGPCDDVVDRWYYEPRARRCEQFKYGNCLGNRNNFNSESECMSHCHRDEEPQTVSICDAPMDHGDGPNRELRYFYNRETAACEAFTYTGAGGNGNRFETQEQCERQCGEYRGEDVCSQPMDVGPCDRYQTRYYYDAATRKCDAFSYGGCEGSGNRFASEEECQSICVSREEPPSESREVCMLSPETGRCQQGNDPHRRWYYDDLRGNCVTFIYNGCGGNQNNFRTYDDCIGFCRPSHQVEQTDPPRSNDQLCHEHSENCDRIACQYDIDTSYNADGCRVCTCSHPCQEKECPEGSVCAVDIEYNPESGTNFVAVCREQEKSGQCPRLANSTTCSRDCYVDSDCRGDKKCCEAGCGYVCVSPHVEQPVQPQRPQVPLYPGSYSPELEERTPEEVNVNSAEGGHAILRCFATGYPPPTVTWHRHGVILNTNQGRYGISTEGDLQIVQLHRTDSGIYVCIADNGLGQVTREVALEVADPQPLDAYIMGPLNDTQVVTLNQPATVRCQAGGYPKPYVTWWRESTMIPLRSDIYEFNRDLSLTIRSVQLNNLGPYVCQAYTGHGKGVSKTITVLAIGPVHTDLEEEKPFLKYLIDVPLSPTTQRAPIGSPYRPTPPPPRVIPPPVVPARVPVTARLVLSTGNQVGIGAEISMKCEVDGHPYPNITWSYNDQEIHQSNRVQIINNEQLVVKGATPEDSGDYKCEGRNEYSHASHTESIVVEGIHVPKGCVDNPFFADCQKIVRGQYCKHNYYARFCCRSCTMAGQLSPAAQRNLV